MGCPRTGAGVEVGGVFTRVLLTRLVVGPVPLGGLAFDAPRFTRVLLTGRVFEGGGGFTCVLLTGRVFAGEEAFTCVLLTGRVFAGGGAFTRTLLRTFGLGGGGGAFARTLLTNLVFGCDCAFFAEVISNLSESALAPDGLLTPPLRVLGFVRGASSNTRFLVRSTRIFRFLAAISKFLMSPYSPERCPGRSC